MTWSVLGISCLVDVIGSGGLVLWLDFFRVFSLCGRGVSVCCPPIFSSCTLSSFTAPSPLTEFGGVGVKVIRFLSWLCSVLARLVSPCCTLCCHCCACNCLILWFGSGEGVECSSPPFPAVVFCVAGWFGSLVSCEGVECSSLPSGLCPPSAL